MYHKRLNTGIKIITYLAENEQEYDRCRMNESDSHTFSDQ